MWGFWLGGLWQGLFDCVRLGFLEELPLSQNWTTTWHVWELGISGLWGWGINFNWLKVKTEEFRIPHQLPLSHPTIYFPMVDPSINDIHRNENHFHISLDLMVTERHSQRSFWHYHLGFFPGPSLAWASLIRNQGRSTHKAIEGMWEVKSGSGAICNELIIALCIIILCHFWVLQT